MFFTKFPHPSNFVFARGYDPDTGILKIGERDFFLSTEGFQEGIYRVTVACPEWGKNRSIEALTPPPACNCNPVRISPPFELKFESAQGTPFLRSVTDKAFGVGGESWMFQFAVAQGTRFYGMGEKNFGRFELSGLRTKFWNTDVWGDFHYGQWKDHPTDPPYLSVPYVILKQGEVYTGILLDTPAPAFMQTPGLDTERVFEAWQNTNPQLIVGAECGEASIWIIHGPSLKELTRKLQKLVGVTPTPPLWALGYHQSRWGYAGHRDLTMLDQKFSELDFPCDALWLDIDYMRGFRVFTFEDEHFPLGFRHTAETLQKSGRKVVAILDPGVKQEPGFGVYDDLKAKDLYCRNEEGGEFVGIVWPGDTVFPDLTLAEAQDWWAEHVACLAQEGMAGVWLDMNDPSTGPVDPTSMLFQHGRDKHAMHRNQYALGMQKGTFQGYLAAKPKSRPFVLSRSGSTGTSKYAAIWTGDNLSNYFYLKTAIPTTLNLSLSGICFNGPDIGGFGDSTTEGLMLDWVKACCLFPFMRNHNSKGSADQEPWAFSPNALDIIRKYVRLRYRLLPYLYNLFCDHEETGDPILRPLVYEFSSTRHLQLEDIDDEFLVGPSILQAPVLDFKKRTRKVLLPGSEPWFCASRGEWLTVGVFPMKPDDCETPMYLRNGSILPFRPGTPTEARTNLNQIDLFICANPDTEGESEYLYRADDGATFDYRRGVRSSIRVMAKWSSRVLDVEIENIADGFGEIEIAILVPIGFSSVRVSGVSNSLEETSLEIAGAPFRSLRVG